MKYTAIINQTMRKRKEKILQAAIELAIKNGYQNIKCTDIAKRAKVTRSLINFYFSNMDELKHHIMQLAISNGELAIIAQGLVAKDPAAVKVPDRIKQKALSYII